MNTLHWLLIGISIGIAAIVPLAMLVRWRTERRVRRLEQRARGAERLAELGTLTGGLAHEIKNPLSTIGLNLQLLRESLNDMELAEPQAGRIRRRMDAVTAEAERLRDILEDFLKYAGRIRLDCQPVSLNEMIDQVADFYSPQAEQSGVMLRTQLDPSLPAMNVDATLLKQAMLNLLINATQAMVQARYDQSPHGGAHDLFVRTNRRGDVVEIHIIDTGPGIAPDKMRRVFEPYFSTKKGGTGLGLAVSRRIAEEHGGTLSLHSEVGQGSDFTITLPTPISGDRGKGAARQP
ncbi:MAG: two-component system sensor histidine kinase NtrB [Phycisphaerales bacterium]